VVVLEGASEVVVAAPVGGMCAADRWLVEQAASNETAVTIAIATGALRPSVPIP